MEYFRSKNGMSLKAVVIIVFLVLVLMILFTLNREKKAELVNFENESYSVQYDSGWGMSNQGVDKFKLYHRKSGSSLNLVIKELDDNNKFKNIDEIADSVLFNLEKQNTGYSLLYKNPTLLTKEEYSGYEVLYETNEYESAVFFFKKESQFIMFTFNASNGYFDILIDNVNSIIYNFNLAEEKYTITSTINLELKQPSFTANAEVSKLIGDMQDCAVVHNNFVVYYSIPKKFKLVQFNSSSGNYELEGLTLNKKIKLYANIYDANIYEYMEVNIKNEFAKTGTASTGNESLIKSSEAPLMYMYKKTYTEGNASRERVKIIYELNRNHVFVVDFDSTNTTVPFDMINTVAVRGYDPVETGVISDAGGMVTPRELVWYLDSNKKEVEHAVLPTIEGFKEIDYGTNLYIERHYASEYNEKRKIYECEVKYELLDIDSIQSHLSKLEEETYKGHGNYRGFMYSGTIAKDIDTVFEMYKREYVKKCENGELIPVYEKVLFFRMRSGRYLVVTIVCNDTDKDNDYCASFVNITYGVVSTEKPVEETEEETQS